MQKASQWKVKKSTGQEEKKVSCEGKTRQEKLEGLQVKKGCVWGQESVLADGSTAKQRRGERKPLRADCSSAL